MTRGDAERVNRRTRRRRRRLNCSYPGSWVHFPSHFGVAVIACTHSLLAGLENTDLMHRRVEPRPLRASTLARGNRVCQSLVCLSEWLFSESTHRLSKKLQLPGGLVPLNTQYRVTTYIHRIEQHMSFNRCGTCMSGSMFLNQHAQRFRFRC